MTDSAAARTPSPFADHTPRMLFGLVIPGDATDPYRMREGAWMRRSDHTFSGAALGAFLDHAFTGASIQAARPRDRPTNVVTTQLSFQLTPGVEPVGELLASSTLVGSEGSVALGEGSVQDSTGQTIAVGSASVQFIPRRQDASHPHRREFLEPIDATIEEILALDIESTDTGATGRTVPGHWLANSMVALHGGVVTAMLEHTAHEALGGAPWRISSLDVHFLRPGPVAEPLEVVATIDHAGRTLGVVSARMLRHDGKAVAVATAAYRR
jgi:acyl-coenzyme A thioesterase PaaI-like protein